MAAATAMVAVVCEFFAGAEFIGAEVSMGLELVLTINLLD
jgi:hypothetical protein